MVQKTSLESLAVAKLSDLFLSGHKLSCPWNFSNFCVVESCFLNDVGQATEQFALQMLAKRIVC
jgi:hypothetical protein